MPEHAVCAGRSRGEQPGCRRSLKKTAMPLPSSARPPIARACCNSAVCSGKDPICATHRCGRSRGADNGNRGWLVSPIGVALTSPSASSAAAPRSPLAATIYRSRQQYDDRRGGRRPCSRCAQPIRPICGGAGRGLESAPTAVRREMNGIEDGATPAADMCTPAPVDVTSGLMFCVGRAHRHASRRPGGEPRRAHGRSGAAARPPGACLPR